MIILVVLLCAVCVATPIMVNEWIKVFQAVRRINAGKRLEEVISAETKRAALWNSTVYLNENYWGE